MTAIRGAVVAVTGAASGIGRALALELAARGADLALADRDEAGLASVAAHPALNILINNAGVALMGAFSEIDQSQMEWLMNVNFWGTVHATRAFLPHLATRKEAHIVNLSSIFGIIGPPGQTAYSASKFAVRGFSESLRHELQMNGRPGAAVGGASRRRRHQRGAQFPHRQRHHRQCQARRVDRA